MTESERRGRSRGISCILSFTNHLNPTKTVYTLHGNNTCFVCCPVIWQELFPQNFPRQENPIFHEDGIGKWACHDFFGTKQILKQLFHMKEVC